MFYNVWSNFVTFGQVGPGSLKYRDLARKSIEIAIYRGNLEKSRFVAENAKYRGLSRKTQNIAIPHPPRQIFAPDWKVANVVPVHKKGSKDNIENYRPISLTNLSCLAPKRGIYDEKV